ncbi:GNAT family N-acetyltransferase [Myxococcota bacterium]|nr:GNAT family N-acetyltransferase [Myxococcota bacterium]
MILKKIDFNSDDYRETLKLRDEVLRVPLGMRLSAKDTVGEETQDHYGLFDDSGLQACLIFKRLSESSLKMRQMAVQPGMQGKGLGRELVLSTEAALWELGIREIELAARKHAIDFYKKLGYGVVSDEFFEVGIPHVRMIKEL